MFNKVTSIKQKGLLPSQWNRTDLAVMASWFKRPGDKALPSTKVDLLRRYYRTCNRSEQERSRLKEGEQPVLNDDVDVLAAPDLGGGTENNGTSGAENNGTPDLGSGGGGANNVTPNLGSAGGGARNVTPNLGSGGGGGSNDTPELGGGTEKNGTPDLNSNGSSSSNGTPDLGSSGAGGSTVVEANNAGAIIV